MDLTQAKTKPDFKYIYFLKFVAILLITNSHFKPVYEGALSQFAFGGAMGCALFFFCSGYTLALGKFDAFGSWMLKRVLRIYPTLWIINLLETLLTGKVVPLQNYLFPLDHHYWFLQAILVFYVAFYFVMKYAKKHILFVATCLALPFLLTYFLYENNKWVVDYAVHPYRLHWYYYFVLMLVGTYCRITPPIIKNVKGVGALVYLLLAVVSFVCSYGLKFIVEKSDWSVSPHLQLLFPIGVCIFTMAMFELSKSLRYGMVFDKLNRFFAGLTLEIYVVQFMVISLCSGCPFPLRFLVTVFVILLLAWCLNRMVSFVVAPVKIAMRWK